MLGSCRYRCLQCELNPQKLPASFYTKPWSAKFVPSSDTTIYKKLYKKYVANYLETLIKLTIIILLFWHILKLQYFSILMQSKKYKVNQNFDHKMNTYLWFNIPCSTMIQINSNSIASTHLLLFQFICYHFWNEETCKSF